MTAGLPGSGLGGLFYVLLVAFMLVRELYLTVRGRSSLARWRTVAVLFGLTAGIVGALTGFSWLTTAALTVLVDVELLAAWLRPAALDALVVTSKTAIVFSLSLIGLAVAGTSMARRLVVRDRRPA